MNENDRSATGFLPPDEFETTANQFFAQPLVSIQGWERAIDAQLRIVREVEHILARNRAGDVLFVGHGAVGTLLFCHYSGFAIDRAYDPTRRRRSILRVRQRRATRAAFMASDGILASRARRRLPLRVKLRRTQYEQISSGLPLKADIARYSRHVSKVPITEMLSYAYFDWYSLWR